MGYPSFEEMRESRGPSPGEVKDSRERQYRGILGEVEKEISRSHDLGFGLFHSAHG